MKSMRLGPILIKKAPGCQQPLKFRTYLSINTFGATYWTDGKCEAKGWPDRPWLCKSPSEGVLFWSDECEEIGQIEYPVLPGTENPAWTNLEYAQTPSEADYFAALTSGIANADEKLLYVRIRLWWAGNDPVRRGEAASLSPAHLANLEALVPLLSTSSPEDTLMKADALRALGRFDEALSLLETSEPKGYQLAVARLRELARARQTNVAKLA